MSIGGRLQIGVDIGGTFTDLVLLNSKTGNIVKEKVLTTPDDPSLGVLTGIRQILRNNALSPGDVERVIHGTTLVANAIIERKGVKTALLTTAGFRDVLEIGRERRYDTNDLFIEMPVPLVPRHLRLEICERVGPDGAVLDELREHDVEEAGVALRSAGIQAVAVSFLHSFRNNAHEGRVGELLKAMLPDIEVSLSHAVAPDIGEYERTSTTVANAYVQPICQRYLLNLRDALREMDIPGNLHLMLSDGGTIDHDTASQCPIRLVQSGPAGGAKAAALIGALAGELNIMCLDIGGTTAKVCLIEDGRPCRAGDFEVARVYRFKKGSGLPLKVPVVDMIEIGAGGGSIARINEQGIIQIGPESSGAKPGPACYGLGGTRPTVTDADLVLGYLHPDSFLGGDMRLEVRRAYEAIEQHIANPLGISVLDGAWGICQAANQNMAQAASIHALEKGKWLSKFSMAPIGGAGPVHACDIARRIGVPRVICPPGAGVASAYGFLASPPAFEFSHIEVSRLDNADMRAIAEALAKLEARGAELLTASAVAASAMRVFVSCAMRYLGQGHEVHVPVPYEVVKRGDKAELLRLFSRMYLELYGRVEDQEDVELISWHLVSSGPEPQVNITSAMMETAGAGEAKTGERAVYFREAGEMVSTPVYNRNMLVCGSVFSGPAIFEERESTVVVPPDAAIRVDDHYNLVIDLR